MAIKRIKGIKRGTLYLIIWLVVLAIIAGAILYLLALQPSSSNVAPSTFGNLIPEKRVIVLSVEGSNITYVQTDTFNKSAYNYILAHWDSYIENVKDDMDKMYASRGAEITSLSIGHPENRIIKIKFVVDNRVTGNDEITADFLWFLNAWNLDFINNHFNETNHGLTWSGTLDSVSTTIIVNVPPQPTPYKAWGSPYGHCHGHIWWPKQ